MFNDLEAQFAAADLVAIEQEIAERARTEQSAVSMLDRLRGQRGVSLRIRTLGGLVFDGPLRHVGSEWVVLETGSGAALVPVAGIAVVEGLGRQARVERSTVSARLGLGSVLRAFARDRVILSVHLAGGGSRIDGIIDRVGRDFLELAAVPLGEQRRPGSVAGVLMIQFRSIEAVLSRA